MLVSLRCVCPRTGVIVKKRHFRRESATMLVEEMYNSLVENLDGVEPPYSLDTVIE